MNRYRFAVFALWLGAGDRVAVATAAPSGGTGCGGSARGRRCRCGARHPSVAQRTRRGDRGRPARADRRARRCPTHSRARPPPTSYGPSGHSRCVSAARRRSWAKRSWPPTRARSGTNRWKCEPQVLSINRLAEADAFLAAGDTAQAQRLLVWHEADFNGDNLTPQLFAPLAYYRLARIEQAQGRTGMAREHYRQFLRRYDQPVPSLRPLVEQARSAVATIEATERKR